MRIGNDSFTSITTIKKKNLMFKPNFFKITDKLQKRKPGSSHSMSPVGQIPVLPTSLL